jgi:TonB family protein
MSLSLAEVSSAQGTGAPEPTNPSEVTPPEWVEFARAEVPEELASAEQREVVAEITVDETGSVAEARVVESAGAELDGVVLNAIRRFVFQPARRGGTPVAAKIRYRYVVEPTAPSTELNDFEPESSDELTPLPDDPEPALPDEREAASGEPASQPDAELEEYSATAEVAASPREVTRRSVEQERLTRIPGTRGDALRSIEVMPGVARPGSVFANPLLRGAAWNESATYLDGVPVPFLFHFGGLTSFMNSRLIERVDLYPSNFSTRFGRVSGGIVEVRSRDPNQDEAHGVLDLNLIDTSLLAETPLGERTAAAAAVRRSNIDFFFEAFAEEGSYSVIAAPD